MWLALTLVITSYMGVEVIAVTAGEADHPETSIPRAMRTMVLRLIIFYVLAIGVMLMMTPWNQLAEGGQGITGSPFVRAFASVELPLAAPGILAGAALSWARALGEFGATMLFAGNLPGVTQTLPLAIYQEFARNFTTALAMSALLVVVSGALLVALRVTLQWQPSKPTSRFLFAPSR